MWETSHPLSFAVAGYAIAASIMPNLVLIAAGHLVGTIPAAAASAGGLGSAAGRRLVSALVVTGVLYAAALVLGPVQSSLSSASGDHASLMRAGGLYAELYELQARAYR